MTRYRTLVGKTLFEVHEGSLRVPHVDVVVAHPPFARIELQRWTEAFGWTVVGDVDPKQPRIVVGILDGRPACVSTTLTVEQVAIVLGQAIDHDKVTREPLQAHHEE